MREYIKVGLTGVVVIKRIIKNIINDERMIGCFGWKCYSKEPEDQHKIMCEICRELFPKIPKLQTKTWIMCPEDFYTKKYLIRRLENIIKYNEDLYG